VPPTKHSSAATTRSSMAASQRQKLDDLVALESSEAVKARAVQNLLGVGTPDEDDVSDADDDLSDGDEEDHGAPSLYDQFLQAGLESRKKEEEAKRLKEKESSKAAFETKPSRAKKPSTIKAGFLNASKPPKAKPKLEVAEKPAFDLKSRLTVEPRGSSTSASTGHVLPDVQDAMAASTGPAERMRDTLMKDKSWLTEDLMKRIASDPLLAAGMANPKCQRALTEFQTDPKTAQAKYAKDPLVRDFITRFMAVMGSHFTEVSRRGRAEPCALIRDIAAGREGESSRAGCSKAS
jgi:hypothetical protein